MKRKLGLLFASLALMALVAAFAAQPKHGLLILEWSAKAKEDTPPAAVLIELGLKDSEPTVWNGRATVTGAKVVHREGYRFRAADKLVSPDGWQGSSHRPIRVPPRNPALAVPLGIDSVGIVLHLADVQPEATVTVEIPGRDLPKAEVPLKEVLAGKPHKLWSGHAVVRLVTTATPVVTAKTEDDFPAAAYGPDGTLWLAYISYHVKDDSRRIEAPQLKEQPANFKAYDTPEFGDQLLVKYYRGGKWSEPMAITGPNEDLVRCAIAVEGNGDAWVIYSANRKGNHRLYARPISKKYSPEAVANPSPRPGAETPLPAIAVSGKHLSPVAQTDNDGRCWVTYQDWNNNGAFLSAFKSSMGEWKSEGSLFRSGEAAWGPAITAGPNDEVMIAYDSFTDGDYDVLISSQGGSRFGNWPVIHSLRFEARPSIACDSKGRLWIAYEEGPEKWGKDYGALDQEDGNPLYFARTVRVVCIEDCRLPRTGRLLRPVADLPPLVDRVASPDTGQKVEKLPRYAYPQIGLDGKGRIWLTYRQKFGNRYSTHPGSYWLTMARRLDGDHWTEPIEVHHSDGLLDHRPVLLPHPSGGLRILHNTDGRYTTPNDIDNQIYMSYLDLPGEPVEPKLVPHDPGKKDEKAGEKEREAVKRIRDYRVDLDGKQYRLLRGEFHRHTEISWDGGPDGSLEDMFRYAIDAASLDWIGNADHDNGAGREYSWWLTQKYTDAYHVKDHFTPMFSYERSVAYPHGHRNCIFARRGIRTLPRLAEPDPDKRVAGINADDTKMLYRYLKELNGLCASHTSATGMGTDWRDHDAAVEPIVEIYQGDRMSYEIEGAPRAGYEAKSGKKPVNIAGWYPKGYINLALEKGYRLGFQSSSDHFSTHISYCIVLADKLDREAIFDGLKKRHCYAATDDIILDVKSAAHWMGDEFKTAAAPSLHIHVLGTAPLAKAEVLRDSHVVHTFDLEKREFNGDWTDPEPKNGVHYYYVRVQQADGEIAWGSPMWIEYTK